MRYILTFILLFVCSYSNANEYADVLKNQIAPKIRIWLNNPDLITEIEAQNRRHINYTMDKINELDQTWRNELNTGQFRLIKKVLNNKTSKILKSLKKQNNTLYTEIFITDNKGINVGQSDITSDYYQGDEDKFKFSFNNGANGVYINPVEFDESSQSFQTQLTLTVTNKNSEPIGTITVGIDIERL